MSRIIIQFNPKYLSLYPGKDVVKIGYTTTDEGDYIRFIDKHGIAYIVPRNNVKATYTGTSFVYNVVGIYYLDSPRPDDGLYLKDFLQLRSIHT